MQKGTCSNVQAYSKQAKSVLCGTRAVQNAVLHSSTVNCCRSSAIALPLNNHNHWRQLTQLSVCCINCVESSTYLVLSTTIGSRGGSTTLSFQYTKLSRQTTSCACGTMPFGSYSICSCTRPSGCSSSNSNNYVTAAVVVVQCPFVSIEVQGARNTATMCATYLPHR
eukprot:2265-Heterococcus_DN1.PRE.2